MKEELKRIFKHRMLKKHPNVRMCEFEGCSDYGEYRAPRRDHPQDIKDDKAWHWLCLSHVQSYNASWNYYKDMTEEEVLQHWRRDISWDRPSWPIGNLGPTAMKTVRVTHAFATGEWTQKEDPFGLFEEFANHSVAILPLHTKEERKAIATLELNQNFNEEELNQNYRKLAKKYHPDLNHNNNKAEDMIKEINTAYKLLKKKFVL